MKRLLCLLTVIFLCAGLRSPLQAGFKPEVKYAQVGDIKLAYYIRGEGEPLVMINGFLATMSLWDPALIQELAKQRFGFCS